MDEFAIRITWDNHVYPLYIRHDPENQENPMFLGFGWETTRHVHDAWTTSDEDEARILLVKWRKSLHPLFDGKSNVINL